MCRPPLAALHLVHGYPVVHFVVEGPAGCDIMHGKAGVAHQPFGKIGFSRTRTAQNQDGSGRWQCHQAAFAIFSLAKPSDRPSTIQKNSVVASAATANSAPRTAGTALEMSEGCGAP